MFYNKRRKGMTRDQRNLKKAVNPAQIPKVQSEFAERSLQGNDRLEVLVVYPNQNLLLRLGSSVFEGTPDNLTRSAGVELKAGDIVEEVYRVGNHLMVRKTAKVIDFAERVKNASSVRERAHA